MCLRCQSCSDVSHTFRSSSCALICDDIWKPWTLKGGTQLSRRGLAKNTRHCRAAFTPPDSQSDVEPLSVQFLSNLFESHLHVLLFHWVIAEYEPVHVVLICFLQPEKSGVGWRREASNSKITTKPSPTQTWGMLRSRWVGSEVKGHNHLDGVKMKPEPSKGQRGQVMEILNKYREEKRRKTHQIVLDLQNNSLFF